MSKGFPWPESSSVPSQPCEVEAPEGVEAGPGPQGRGDLGGGCLGFLMFVYSVCILPFKAPWLFVIGSITGSLPCAGDHFSFGHRHSHYIRMALCDPKTLFRTEIPTSQRLHICDRAEEGQTLRKLPSDAPTATELPQKTKNRQIITSNSPSMIQAMVRACAISGPFGAGAVRGRHRHPRSAACRSRRLGLACRSARRLGAKTPSQRSNYCKIILWIVLTGDHVCSSGHFAVA